MNKIIRFMKLYIIAGFIFCITLMLAWKTNIPTQSADQMFAHIPRIINNVIGLGLVVWFITLTVFLFSMITLKSIRERYLKKLANIKDQDEREDFITGKASRAAYLSSLSLMLFFLFFSVCGVSFKKAINPALNEGHKYSASLTFGYEFMNNTEVKNNDGVEVIFDSRELIPSSSTIMLILIAAQLLAYNFTIRRERIED